MSSEEIRERLAMLQDLKDQADEGNEDAAEQAEILLGDLRQAGVRL